MTEIENGTWFELSRNEAAQAWAIEHAAQIIQQEIDFLEQENADGYFAYHQSYWWQQYLAQPWVTPVGLNELIASWLNQSGIQHEVLAQLFPDRGLNPAIRSQYRNIYHLGEYVDDEFNWTYFDLAAQEFNQRYLSQSAYQMRDYIGIQQKKQFLELEKPWRSKTLAGFPALTTHEDFEIQYCVDELMFWRQEFYLALFAAHAPTWQYLPERSSKNVLTHVRPIDEKWQWAILGYRRTRTSWYSEFELVIIPRQGKRPVKPSDVIFQYRFPFRQNHFLGVSGFSAWQGLAMWQMHFHFMYQVFETRMNWLAPLLQPYLDSL